MPDIDLDFPDRNKALAVIKHVPAVIADHNVFKKHNTGVYCHNIPINPLTGNSSIDYKEADERGYFKIDFLNVSVYKGVRDEAHLDQLLNQEPLWDLLLEEEFSDLLFQLNGHSKELQIMQPKTVEQLAAVLAIIRPAKRHLIGKSWDDVFKEVWIKPIDGEYYWKKAHAIAYAHVILVQMNLICEQISYGYS